MNRVHFLSLLAFMALIALSCLSYMFYAGTFHSCEAELSAALGAAITKEQDEKWKQHEIPLSFWYDPDKDAPDKQTLRTESETIAFGKEGSILSLPHDKQLNQFKHTYLAMKYPLNVQTLDSIYREELRRRGISVQTAISYTYKDSITEVSRQDAAFFPSASHTAEVILGIREEIKIQGFAQLTPSTIFVQAPWMWAGFATVCIVIVFGGILGMMRFKKEKPSGSAEPVQPAPNQLAKNIILDVKKSELIYYEKRIHLTGSYCKFLEQLWDAPGNYKEYGLLIRALYGDLDNGSGKNRLTQLVNRLRSEVLVQANTIEVINFKRSGYKLIINGDTKQWLERIKYFLCLSPVIFIAGCTGVPEGIYSNYKSFPEEQKLVSQAVPIDTVLLRYPYRIAIKDSVILIMDLHPLENYFHAFSYPEGRFLASFGRRGQGAGEMLSAENFRFNSLDSIWVLDANRKETARWRLSLNPPVAGREEVVGLDASLVRTLDFCLADSGFIVPEYLGEYRYKLLDKNGRLIGANGFILTKENKKVNLSVLSQGWRSFFALNPRKNVLAMATQLGEVLEIYHLDDSTQSVVYGPNGEPKFQLVQNEGVPNGIMGYFDVQITGRYIYAVFSGQSFKDIKKNLESGTINERGGRYIYVFDMDGKPVCKYILDRAVCGIYIHESENVIYAVDANSDDAIVKFKLPL